MTEILNDRNTAQRRCIARARRAGWLIGSANNPRRPNNGGSQVSGSGSRRCTSMRATSSAEPNTNGTLWCSDSGCMSISRLRPALAMPPACSIRKDTGLDW
jgi:hypothetical protein